MYRGLNPFAVRLLVCCPSKLGTQINVCCPSALFFKPSLCDFASDYQNRTYYTLGMHTQMPNFLLFVEPSNDRAETPVIDDLTRKMAAAFLIAKSGTIMGGTPDDFREGARWHGVQQCACGRCSSAVDYLLPSGLMTNSLCVHYLAWHRSEIPQSELDKVASLPDEYVDPTEDQLA